MKSHTVDGYLLIKNGSQICVTRERVTTVTEIFRYPNGERVKVSKYDKFKPRKDMKWAETRRVSK